MLIELNRLTIPRLRRVARALKALHDDRAFVRTLHADVRGALEAAVQKGAPLDTAAEVSPLLIDTTTDSVLSNFEDMLLAMEGVANDRVVRPSTEALAKKADAMTLRQRVFPQRAKAIIDLSMSDQHKAMRDLAEVLTTDREATACVRRLGIDWAVAHLVAHLDPYQRAVRSSDGRALSTDAEDFHAALTRLAVKVTALHEDDAELRRAVLGPYEVELAAQQQEERDARKRQAAKRSEDPTK